jgi:phosphopantothenoylcysteine decarboxylase/phosphopantothenate--cysteine ligase
VVSAGGTREPLDPVRFLGNRSSGRQGYALAESAAARGAEVVLVAANVSLPDPAGVEVVRVGTAAELGAAVRAAAATADAVVMAAAVADFRPAQVGVAKIKKSGAEPAPVVLVRNDDVLRGLVTDPPRTGLVVVGFAAETGDAATSWLDHGRAKLAAKGCDLLVVNRVGDGVGFEVADNAAVVLGSDGSEIEVPLGPKQELAEVVWDLVAPRLAAP